MHFNVCKICKANSGWAGKLINGLCLNCHDTKKTGDLVIHADLYRTNKELQTMAKKLLK